MPVPKWITWPLVVTVCLVALALTPGSRAATGPATFSPPMALPSSGYITSGPPSGAPSCLGPQLAYAGQEGGGFGWVPVSPSPEWPSYAVTSPPPGSQNLLNAPELRVAPYSGGFLYAWVSDAGYLTFAFLASPGSWTVVTTPQSVVPDTTFDLVTSGSSIYLAWVAPSSPNGTLMTGQLFSNPWTLTSTAVVDADATHVKADVRLVADGGALDVVWRRSNINGTEAYFAHVVLGGSSSVPVPVTPGLSAIHQFAPVVAAFANGTALVTLDDYDGGSVPALPAAYIAPPYTAFGPVFNLGSRIGGVFPDQPQLLTEPSGSLHLAWLNAAQVSNSSGGPTYAADLQVMYAESADGGLSFSPPVRVDNDSSPVGKRLAPLIEGTNGDLYAAWSGGASSTPMIARGLMPGVRAAFTTTPDVLFTNESVSFNGTASALGGPVSSYAWSFGDGGTSTGAQPTHVYAVPGTYLVSLAVTDPTGNIRTACESMTVASAVTFTSFTHPAGFRLDVPSSWQLQENATIAGQTIALVATGPATNGFRTNVLVSTEANASVQETSTYLLNSVQATVQSLQATNPSVYLDGAPVLRTLGGYPAVSFVVRYGPVGIVQKIALVVSRALQRDWVLILSCDSTVYPWMNVTFEHMLSSFTVTLSPPLIDSGLFLVLAIGAAVGAAAAIGVFLAFRRRQKTPGVAAPGAGPSAAVLACPNCGASLEPGGGFCGSCGAPSPGTVPAPPKPPGR